MELENKEARQEKSGGGSGGNIRPSSIVNSAQLQSMTRSSDELPKRILVPLDGSDFSFHAAKYAISLARVTGGEIICVHAVVELPYLEYMGAGIVPITSYTDQ